MIDYETYMQIRNYSIRDGLRIAEELSLDQRTVANWIDKKRYQPRQTTLRKSKGIKPTFTSLAALWLFMFLRVS